MNSPDFSRLEGEREVALHLSASDSLAAAAHAPGTAKLIDDRLKSIEHDLSRLDDDLQACIDELDHCCVQPCMSCGAWSVTGGFPTTCRDSAASRCSASVPTSPES